MANLVSFRYKGERERQFKEHEARHVGSRGDIAKKIEDDTKAKIEGMNAAVGANKAAVIDSLINLSCDIKPEIHRNFRG